MEGHEAEMTAAERKRKRAEDEASYALLKTILNAIFVTTGLVLLLAVIVVIVYTTFGTCVIAFVRLIIYIISEACPALGG